MTNDELIRFTKKFMDETRDYSEFRHGGNLGRIVAGHLVAEKIERLTDAVASLASAIELHAPPIVSGEAIAEEPTSNSGAKY